MSDIGAEDMAIRLEREANKLERELIAAESRVATLTAERDRLRADLAAVAERSAAANPYWRIRSDRHEAERDAALASLAAERERTARMRAVVEAARVWRGQPWLTHSASRRARSTNALIATVDALDAGAATGGEDGT